MDRSKKPPAIGVAGSVEQPTVTVDDHRVDAQLPSGEFVSVYLYGATVASWKLADGEEQLFVSSKAKLDGSKPIRGGIPIVFPVFGPPPKNHATSNLPQHGFARNSTWEFLGKSSSESLGDTTGGSTRSGDSSVKLDFGLSSQMLSENFRRAWPYQFGLVYSVTLSPDSLETSLQVQNKDEKAFDFHVLLHSYFRVKDISQTRVTNLQDKNYSDKTDNYAVKREISSAVAITGEVDRVYEDMNPTVPVSIISTENNNTPQLSITREMLNTVTLWNPWVEKAKGMSDFDDEEYKVMVCVESGAVSNFQSLEAGDSWVGSQTIKAHF